MTTYERHDGDDQSPHGRLARAPVTLAQPRPPFARVLGRPGFGALGFVLIVITAAGQPFALNRDRRIPLGCGQLASPSFARGTAARDEVKEAKAECVGDREEELCDNDQGRNRSIWGA